MDRTSLFDLLVAGVDTEIVVMVQLHSNWIVHVVSVTLTTRLFRPLPSIVAKVMFSVATTRPLQTSK